jgi:diguanylate cyclase (GGDEF)-like protein
LFRGDPARFVMAVDVTDMERESQELLHRAHHDALTGLPNRHELEIRIDRCLERSVRDLRKAALLTIDVDHFKQVNDTYGHLVGDECLKAVSARLQSRIRQMDTLARTGGEEFTAIIGGLSSKDDAQKISSMLLRIFDEPMALSACEIHLSISIGVAIFPDDGADRETLVRRSDEALYEAKRAGRNRAMFASASA